MARTHGHCRPGLGNKNQSREYTSYRAMVARCTNPATSGWKYYGGRGIKIYPDWLGDGGFERFLAHMGPRPDAMTLDRPNSNGNYEPGNVQWADKWEQAKNRREIPLVLLQRNGHRMREARMRVFARASLERFGRILGFHATERLMREIRDELEETFGPPANMPEPRELLSVESAFLVGDFTTPNFHFEGLTSEKIMDPFPKSRFNKLNRAQRARAERKAA